MHRIRIVTASDVLNTEDSLPAISSSSTGWAGILLRRTRRAPQLAKQRDARSQQEGNHSALARSWKEFENKGLTPNPTCPLNPKSCLPFST